MKGSTLCFIIIWIHFHIGVQTEEYLGNVPVSEDFLIQTAGCSIPNYMKTNYLDGLSDKPWNYEACGLRMINLERLSENTVQFRIDNAGMRRLNCQHCFYSLRDNKDSVFTTATVFNDSQIITISSDTWFHVECFVEANHSVPCYSDWYMILVKAEGFKKRHIVKTDRSADIKRLPWNILLMGVDTMSRGRFKFSMPNVLQYFKQEGWLDFRGHHKVGYNTLPNLMTLMTGKHYEFMQTYCLPLETAWCKDLFLFREFSKAGYVTAYGDDTELPTFSHYKYSKYKDLIGYDHYFSVPERERKNEVDCCGKKPSSFHILKQALHFTSAYKQDKFFALYWMVTPSHSMKASLPNPSPLQRSLTEFFNQIQNNGLLNNTFVFFIGDHGINFGHAAEMLPQVHYDTKLPMFFLWVPHEFRSLYSLKYQNLLKNQYQLTSHYDTYATMVEILKLSTNLELGSRSGCTKCTSLMQEIPEHRECVDANIDDVMYCACHSLNKTIDKAGHESIFAAISDLNRRLYKANLNRTWSNQCSRMNLKKILRNDFYLSHNRTYYVAAGILSPGNLVFESTVTMPKEGIFQILNMQVLSYIDGKCSQFGDPTLSFCVCKQMPSVKQFYSFFLERKPSVEKMHPLLPQ